MVAAPKIEPLEDGAEVVTVPKIEPADEAGDAPPPKTEAFEVMNGDGEEELLPKTEVLSADLGAPPNIDP